MPRIDDNYLDCVIYLYPTKEVAMQGKKIGGTGFLVALPSEVEGFYYYAVTNSHVIREGRSPVIRLNTKEGATDILELKDGDWIHHPDHDNLAVTPIALHSDNFKYQALNRDLVFIDKYFIAEHDIGIGDDVFMVGRFINHEGTQSNIPALRFGNIAMMPEEPVKHHKGHMQESFLVEMRSIGGYSGSPVFVYIPAFSQRPREAGVHPGLARSKPRLLGVDWGHILREEKIIDGSGNPHSLGWKVKTNTGMAAVVPAWRLNDLLNIGELVTQRQKEDQRLLEKQRREEV